MLSLLSAIGTYNVYQVQAARLQRSQLPALVFDTESESVVQQGLGHAQERALVLAITGTQVATEAQPNVSYMLDEIDQDVAEALFSGPLGTALAVRYLSMQKTYSHDGEDLIGAIALAYEVRYMADDNAPGT